MPRPPRYRVTGIAWLLAATAFPLPALGQETAEPPRERAAAEVLFEAGHAAMDAGDYDTACQKFEASMKLDPAPGTLMNLGNCEEKRGRVASAWERYVAAQRELTETDRRYEFVQGKIAELEPKVPRVTIVLADGAPEKTEVRRDDIELTGSLGVPLPLDPGSYAIVVSAEGHESRTIEVELELGERRELEVAPGDAVVAGEVSQVGAEGTPRFGPLTKRQWGYVAGGIGVAGTITALTAGAFAYKKMKVMEDHCDGGTGLCDGRGFAAYETGGTLTTVANVAGGVGLVGLGVGIALILTSESDGTAATFHDARSGVTARFDFSARPGFGSLQVKGEF